MGHDDQREWLTKDEIMQLFSTDLKVVVAEWVRELISHEIGPFHLENRRRFEHIERGLSEQNVQIAQIKEQNVSQNREISNIGSRQAERYEQQRSEEERACQSRHDMLNQLQIINDKIFLNATDTARMAGREQIKEEYWTTGKKIVAGGATIGGGAVVRALWPLLKRFFGEH